jgi:hypothetical protein
MRYHSVRALGLVTALALLGGPVTAQAGRPGGGAAKVKRVAVGGTRAVVAKPAPASPSLGMTRGAAPGSYRAETLTARRHELKARLANAKQKPAWLGSFSGGAVSMGAAFVVSLFSPAPEAQAPFLAVAVVMFAMTPVAAVVDAVLRVVRQRELKAIETELDAPSSPSAAGR